MELMNGEQRNVTPASAHYRNMHMSALLNLAAILDFVLVFIQ